MTAELPDEQITQLRASIEEWRRSRKTLGTMPENLWASATRLAREFGVSEIARALKIDHGKLKRLSGKPVSELKRTPKKLVRSSPTACATPPTFLEVKSVECTSSLGLGPSRISCKLEVEKEQSRLRAQLENVTALDVATIFREFTR